MSQKHAIPKAVSMYQSDWDIVEAVNERYQFRNVSAAMRYIVNEYRRCQKQETVDQEVPHGK